MPRGKRRGTASTGTTRQTRSTNTEARTSESTTAPAVPAGPPSAAPGSSSLKGLNASIPGTDALAVPPASVPGPSSSKRPNAINSAPAPNQAPGPISVDIPTGSSQRGEDKIAPSSPSNNSQSSPIDKPSPKDHPGNPKLPDKKIFNNILTPRKLTGLVLMITFVLIVAVVSYTKGKLDGEKEMAGRLQRL